MRTNRFGRLYARAAILSLIAVVAAGAQNPSSGQVAAPPLPPDIPATAARYSVLLTGNSAGQQAVWTAADGSLHMFFQFNDRGRGPRVTSVLKLDEQGVPLSETVTGNDYLKSPVHETYAREAGTAHWKSDSEEGEKKVAGPAIYVALNGAPAEIGVLAKVAIANGGAVALLPDGQAKIERLTEVSLATAAEKRQVALYAITGLDFAPTYVWLDDRLTFFGAVDPWSTIIADGWEGSVKTLQDAQDQAAHARAADLAAKLAHPAPNGIAFAHVNLFDAESGRILKDQGVIVEGDRIKAFGPAGQMDAPAGAEVVDGTGKTLLPGLWDMHAHVAANDGLLNLAAGVTTVRDLGNDIDSLLARRKRIEEGKEIGTRIVLAGIMDGPGPFQGPTKVLVSTPDEARAAVDKYAGLGYVQIKIYSSVKPELVPVIVKQAHLHGLRVSGHIPAGMTAAQCVELGYDEIQHVNFLVLNFMPDVKNTNTTSRFTEVAKRGADINLNSPQFRSFVKLLQDHHTVLDPTLSVFEDMFEGRAGTIPAGYEAVAGRLPPQVRRGLLTVGLTPPAGMDQRYRRSFQKMEDVVGAMYRAGIPIESGTDSIAGFALDRELELHVKAGIPAARVLQDATVGAARIMSMDKELGSIAPGKLADLVLVDGDPAARISDIRKTVLVVKNGIIYRPQELDATLGVTP